METKKVFYESPRVEILELLAAQVIAASAKYNSPYSGGEDW